MQRKLYPFALSILLSLVCACTVANKNAATGVGVGTGESIGGGGNYATILERVTKEIDFGLSLIANNAIQGSFCTDTGVDATHVAEVETLLRANAAQVRIAVKKLKFKVVPESLTVVDDAGKLRPVRAKLLPNDQVVLQQADVDAGNARALVTHEGFHESGPFADFKAVGTYTSDDGGQKRLDDAGLCVDKVVEKYFAYAAATDLTFRGGISVQVGGQSNRTMTLDSAGNIFWVTQVTVPSDMPAFPRVQSYLRKYSSGGVQDAAFGTVAIPEPPGATRGGRYIFNVTVQNDGKVIVAGTESQYGQVNKFFFYRVLASGQPDATFNSTVDSELAGFASYYTGFNGTALVLQGEKIVAGGYRCDTTACLYLVLRLNADGRRDTEFGTNNTGIAYAQVNNFAQVNRLVSTVDGGIFVTGSAWDDNSAPVYRFGWAKFDANGKLQARGSEAFSGTIGQQPVAATVQADGKIVVGGYAETTTGGKTFALMRFRNDGSLDSTFGNGGKQVLNFPNATGLIGSLFVQADGKIVGTGGLSTTAGAELGIFRLTSDGAIDTTYRRGTQTGLVRFLVEPNSSAAQVLRMPDGKVLVAGNDGSDTSFSAFLTRLYGEQEL